MEEIGATGGERLRLADAVERAERIAHGEPHPGPGHQDFDVAPDPRGQVVGQRLGSRTVRRRLEAPELAPREHAFLNLIGQTLLEVGVEVRPEVFVGGTAGLVGGARAEEVEATIRLVELLERRAAVLELVSEALEPQRPIVHVGPDLGGSEVHAVSLVGATYGIRSTPLGAVGLIGPLRMDYEKAIRTVRAAAFELSRLVEDVYENA
jgi:heat-inducible transcriptional repressor